MTETRTRPTQKDLQGDTGMKPGLDTQRDSCWVAVCVCVCNWLSFNAVPWGGVTDIKGSIKRGRWGGARTTISSSREIKPVISPPPSLFVFFSLLLFFFYRCIYHSKVGYITKKIKINHISLVVLDGVQISDFFFLRPSKFLQRWFRSQVSVRSPFGKGERIVKKKEQSYVLAGCFRLLQRNINCKTFESVRIFLCNFCIAIQIDGVVWWCRFYV